MNIMSTKESNNRRSFIKHTAAITGGILINPLTIDRSAYASGSDVVNCLQSGRLSRE